MNSIRTRPDRGLPAPKVAVVGQGYVGLPLAMHAVRRGYQVVGLDVNQRRVKSLQAGQSFVADISDEELGSALDTKRYQVSSEAKICENFDVAIIAVPTPLRDGTPDLSYVAESSAALAPYVRPGSTVVLESSTYPGTTEEIVRPALEAGSELRAEVDFFLGYSPERIDPGTTDHPFWSTPKLVSGVGPTSLHVVSEFYSTLVDKTVPVSGPKVAELAKLLENTFRHVNIALVNEVARYAHELDIDVWEAIDAAATKPFGFMRFVPGPGVGGHCLPIDPKYLSWQVMRRLGETFRFVELANDVNAHMPDYVVNRAIYTLNRARKAVNGSRILLLGLAYKPNTGDMRESPSLAVAERLLDCGADLRAHDEHVHEDGIDPRLTRVPLRSDELRWADLVILLTDHDDVDYGLVAAEAGTVLDTRHRITGPQVEYL
jgi:UDP-N-acetyl-D-glucosamine dehydrogenase